MHTESFIPGKVASLESTIETMQQKLASRGLLYGKETVRQALALLDRSEKFFGLARFGPDMEGSAMHQTLLAAYDKLFAGMTSWA